MFKRDSLVSHRLKDTCKASRPRAQPHTPAHLRFRRLTLRRPPTRLATLPPTRRKKMLRAVLLASAASAAAAAGKPNLLFMMVRAPSGHASYG